MNKPIIRPTIEVIGARYRKDGNAHLIFKGGLSISLSWENLKIVYSDYFRHGEFPTDPITGEKLELV